MKIAAVVVLYNPTKEIINNINSYINFVDIVYAVDNSSTNNLKMIPTNKKIKYIPNEKNLGIAKALNIGAQNAIENGYEWLLTMDQDSSFNSNDIDIMIKYLIEMKQKDVDYYYKIGLVSPFHKMINKTIPDTYNIDYPLMVMTSGNIINLNAYKKIGGFKDELFIDTVDFDYCLNLRNYNYFIIRLNNVILNHNLGELVYGSLFGRKMYSSNHSPVRRYYMVRNRHYIYDMYHSYYPDYCNAEIGRTKRELVKIWGCEKKRLKKTIYMLRGYIDYKKGITGSYDDRKKAKKSI